jgi:hypothetical protein
MPSRRLYRTPVAVPDRLGDLDLGSVEASWAIRDIGKIGVRSSGPASCMVPG